MGRAITLAFAREGAIVVATDINTKLLAKTAKEASELSGRPVDWFKMDVTKKDQIAQTVQSVVDKYGRIDVLHQVPEIACKAGVPHLEEFVANAQPPLASHLILA